MQKNIRLFMVLAGIFLTVGCSSTSTHWTNWDYKDEIAFSKAIFSLDETKIYFARAYTAYKYRDHYGFGGNIGTEYELKYRKSALYEMDLNTLAVREIKVISSAEAGTGSITSESNSVFAININHFIGLRGNRLYYSIVSHEFAKAWDLNVYSTSLDRSTDKKIHSYSNRTPYYNWPGLINNSETLFIYSISENRSGNDVLMGGKFQNSVYALNIQSGTVSTIISDDAFRKLLSDTNSIYRLKFSSGESSVIVGVEDTLLWKYGTLTIHLDSLSTETSLEADRLPSDLTYVNHNKTKFVYSYSNNLFLADYDANLSSFNYHLAGGINLTKNISNESWGIFYTGPTGSPEI